MGVVLTTTLGAREMEHPERWTVKCFGGMGYDVGASISGWWHEADLGGRGQVDSGDCDKMSPGLIKSHT